MPISIVTQIEIAATPSAVRERFLDFASIPKYHPNGFLVHLGPAIPGKPLEVGDVMDNKIGFGKFKPVVLENSPMEFRWLGKVTGVFSGEHFFRFQPSETTPGSTTFVHGENFSGALAFVMGTGFVANLLGVRSNGQSGFEKYNEDLKKWVEGGM